MGQTLAEKIIARAAHRTQVKSGEIVTCHVDLAMIHDSGGPRRVKPMLESLGRPVWDADRVVVVSDHYVPAVDAASAAILQLTRQWVADQGIRHFYDMRGICHVVLPEHGHLKPGMLVVGGDSHSPTGGAYGCFMFGVGATDMVGVLATGTTWLKVPETVELRWDGELGPGITAKDMMLAMCAQLGLGGVGYHAIEYTGSTIASLDQSERMTLSNMAAELGAQTGLIAPDATTMAALHPTHPTHPAHPAHPAGGNRDSTEGNRDSTEGNRDSTEGNPPTTQSDYWASDADAQRRATHHFIADTLEPQIAAPHSPANSAPASEHAGVRVDQAYIGACTGAKLIDLQRAAAILRGRSVASSTRLLIAPASARTTALASADGTLQILLDAGAILLPTGCGACAGYGAGILADGEVCLASTARNFKGRMGSHKAEVYLGSPYSVAAAAITGSICDPRELLK